MIKGRKSRLEVGFLFQEGYRAGSIWIYISTDAYESDVSFVYWYLFMHEYKPLYFIYWFCLWPFWPLNLWFHSLFKVFSHVNAHVLWTLMVQCKCLFMVYVYYVTFLYLSSWIFLHDLVFALVGWLITFLEMKLSNQKITKTSPIFCSLFWDCTSLFTL